MKILLLQLKRIGDLILTTPAIRCLREAFPESRLAVVVDSSCAGLLSCLDADERWIYHKGGGAKGLAGWGENAWLRHGLLPFRPDWVLDFTGTDRSAYLSALARSRRRVTFQRFQKKPLRGRIYTDFVKSSVVDRHTADHYTDLLAPLGIERANVPLDLQLSEKTSATARALLANARVPDSYVVVHAGTARSEKYWLAERWAKVIEFLRAEYGLVSVLTGSRDPRERDHLAEIKSHLRCDCIDLSGTTDLAGLAALIKRATLFCGVDTAAMHLADAVRTPCLALFGPTNPYHWRPRHTRSVILRARTQQPFAPRQEGGPMRDITVASVIDAVRELFAGPRPTSDA
ncbi:MAG TPA: glycosyltransferase family 9 protein [Terrimicrobiaceae bacterium]|nr:glycosyltransferase family 9 protein [Terrimicrobiaceae bacterium]